MSSSTMPQVACPLDLRSILTFYDEHLERHRIKLVRHADSRVDLEAIIQAGLLDAYESVQGRPVFHDCDVIVRFVGEQGTRSRFVGCSRVVGFMEGVGECPAGFPFPEIWGGNWSYTLEPMPAFADLHDRLIIDWGLGTRSWVQSGLNKPVLEIRPRGFVAEFTGYEDVVLSFDALARIVEHADANRVWHRTLAAVGGVYLIVDLQTGNQYVGSAYGDGGIFGRWENYVRTRHGGNTMLKALVGKDPERARSFQFSILRTVPKTQAAREVIEIESCYKRKLGTRAFGLNVN